MKLDDHDFVKFTLEGDPQVYSLAYDFNAMCEAEEKTGVNILAVSEGSDVSARGTRALLFAFLLTGHPMVTKEEAGDLLSRDRSTVSAAIGTVLRLGIEVPAEPAAEAAAPAQEPIPEAA